MDRQNGVDNRFRAICGKMKAVSRKEQIKLLLKLMLRAVGVKKPLFLGGYYREEDERQRQWDEQIVQKLQAEIATGRGLQTILPIAEGTVVSDETTVMPPENGKQLEEELRQSGSYLALAVQSLDKGGLEEVVRLLAVELIGKQIPIKIFCIRDGGEIAEDLQRKGIEVILFHGNKDALEQYCKESPPLLVNTHYVLEHLDVFRQLGIPVVEVIHNMYVFLNQTGLAIERSKHPHISHYIAVSQKAKEIYLGKFPELPAEQISVIGNALGSVKRVDRSREEMRAALGIAEDALVYIVVGSIDARKNQIGILRAWDILKRLTHENIVLVMAGGGTDHEYEMKVQDFVKERKLDNGVIFTGHTKEIYNLLNAADVFVLDSYYEGWSIAATEALSCGLPLIHADCGSGRELICGGRNGILIDHPLQNLVAYDSMALYDVMHAGINENIEQLAAAMLVMLEQRAYWKAQRTSIQQYAAENFSSSKVLDRYLEVFQNTWKNGAKADE